jgi:hypothetical protein
VPGVRPETSPTSNELGSRSMHPDRRGRTPPSTARRSRR